MNPKQFVPEFDFTMAEFYRHFNYYCHKTERMTFDMSCRYFSRCYPLSAVEAVYKQNRFMAVLRYLRTRAHEFQEFVVVGENRKVLVKDAFLAAVASYYLAIPEEFIHTEPERNYVVATTHEILAQDRERESRRDRNYPLTNLPRPTRPDLQSSVNPANSLHMRSENPEDEHIGH